MPTQQLNETVSLEVENVGGIRETRQQFQSGITILTGRNATNRTSFLQAIMAALGSNSDQISLRAGADKGRVELTIGDEMYMRKLTRGAGTGEVNLTGDPFTNNVEEADLFAFLISENDVRQEIRSGADNLRDIVMRPVDTEAINEEKEQLQEEINDLDTQLKTLERKQDNLPALEERQNQFQEKIAQLDEQIAAKEAELEEVETTLEEANKQEEKFEEVMGRLNAKRSDLNNTKDELKGEKSTLQTLKQERKRNQEELENLESPAVNQEDLKQRRTELTHKKEELNAEIEELTSVINFNRELLNEKRPNITKVLGDQGEPSGADELTQQLVTGSEMVCWTCGHSVNRDRIQQTIKSLESYREEKRDERSERNSEIQDINDQISTIRSQRSEKQSLEQELDNLDEKIATAERNIDSIETRIDTLEDEVAELEDEVDQLETSDVHNELVKLNKELNALQRERDSKQKDLERIEDEIQDAEDARQEYNDTEDKRKEKQTRLQKLRGRIQNLDEQAVANFNEHMDEVLDILGYENISRIWIERKEKEERVGRRKENVTKFDLHVVRESDTGNGFEDTVKHLSESEREVVGLIFALAGYLTHEVYEDMPFVLLDSLEAIDAKRIADVIDYFNDYAEYTVAALLPEDTESANSLEATQTIISEI